MRLWPFGKRRVAATECDRSWKVGDLGECVRDDWHGPVSIPADVPRVGDLVKVHAIHWLDDHDHHLFLVVKPDVTWQLAASHFRKIVIQHEPAKTCFAEAMRDLLPKPVPVKAIKRGDVLTAEQVAAVLRIKP